MIHCTLVQSLDIGNFRALFWFHLMHCAFHLFKLPHTSFTIVFNASWLISFLHLYPIWLSINCFWSSINEIAASGTPRTRKKSLSEDILARARATDYSACGFLLLHKAKCLSNRGWSLQVPVVLTLKSESWFFFSEFWD